MKHKRFMILCSLIGFLAVLTAAEDPRRQKMCWAHYVGWGFNLTDGYDLAMRSPGSWMLAPFGDRTLLGKNLQWDSGIFFGARKQIDDSVTHAFLPSAQQFPQYVFRDKDSLRQYIDEVCAGDMQRLESWGSLRADVFKDNARQMLDAARKFETAEDRTRYAPLIRRIEEGMAGLGQKVAAFDEYVASARRELKAKVAAWKHDIEEYLLSERNRKAAEQKKKNRKYKIFCAIGIAAAVIVVVALLVDLFLGRLF